MDTSAAAVPAGGDPHGPEALAEAVAKLHPVKEVPLLTKRLAVGFRWLREDLRWAQKKLAQEAGVSRSMIGWVELAERKPTVQRADEICRAMGFPFSRLLIWAENGGADGWLL